MFIKTLSITSYERIIRQINFRMGINLIIDETPLSNEETGNNVGKTTVLKLIDYCLGGKASSIYVDTETRRDVYKYVKDYLVDNDVIICLVMVDDFSNPDMTITIERNFKQRKEMIRRINGVNYTEASFEAKLRELIFPSHTHEKPTFRQIISHNIRYNDENINNTLKTLDKYTTDMEYETLYLYLFGCEFHKGNEKLNIIQGLNQELAYKSRLEKNQTKTAYETALTILSAEIEDLNKRKFDFSNSSNFEYDLASFNDVKLNINRLSHEISTLRIRKNIILEAVASLESDITDIDMQQLRRIYKQAKSNIDNLQRSFEELVDYHNSMVHEKVRFISKDLPVINSKIEASERKLEQLLAQEKAYSEIIRKSDSIEDLERIIVKLNEKYRLKGEYESIIKQIEEVEANIKDYFNQLKEIDDLLFSGGFEQNVRSQISKFNRHFSSLSNYLYGERYAIKYDIITNQKGQTLYKFSAFNTNLSSGKKQGEISCFDIAYTLFADEEGIPCLHFLLNDKKELMHDNQLVKVADFVNKQNIQLVFSILKDKLPNALDNEAYFVIKLSQNDKLFRI